MKLTPVLAAVLYVATAIAPAFAHESLWIEAETLHGIEGTCYPAGRGSGGRTRRNVTNGHWGVSGPGWAAEWNMGGESGFTSIACGADDDKAEATKDIEIPTAGAYALWVRYRDVREASERFTVTLEQPGHAAQTQTYGEKPMIDEDNEMKLYWNWAFVWDSRPFNLGAGPAKLILRSAFKEPDNRQIDVFVLTTDPAYRPQNKMRPANPTWQLLDTLRSGIPDDVKPLARQTGHFETPAAWTPKTFQDRGFLYLWNVVAPDNWAGPRKSGMLYPYLIRGDLETPAFLKQYAGKEDVPIFSDPRIVPTIGAGDYRSSGPAVLGTDAAKPEQKSAAEAFTQWLDADPKRLWAYKLNYAPDSPISDAAKVNWEKYRDRYVGGISGENLGYFDAYFDTKAFDAEMANVTSRRTFADALTKYARAGIDRKWQAAFGRPMPGHYQYTIPCQSVQGISFYGLSYDWGARTVGYESSVATSSLLGMRTAFLRGAARQHGGLTAVYRSCNFGDSATIFNNDVSVYNKPINILDNFYSVYSGAGMTWYKMDIWYQYMAGASMFYHEQGFDEFWVHGGTTAAGRYDIELSPKGKLVDRFLRTTAKNFDRGTPYTPVAFLVDYANGWEPAPYRPYWFGNFGEPLGDATRIGDHEAMMQSYFWTAYHPIGPKSEAPITGTNETYVPGVFGDIFDVISAYPDVKKWTTIDTYPVVILTGKIEMTAPEAQRLNRYIENGGTVLVADSQLPDAAARALNLPQGGATAEADSYRWLDDAAPRPSQRFRYRPLSSGTPLATTADGKALCAAYDRGKGRLVYLSIPLGMGIDRQAHPVVAHLFEHLTRGLMPVEVQGDVEWSVNKTATGWMVTLLNPAGQDKPQQGITPTDFRQNRKIRIRTHVPATSAVDRLLPTDTLTVQPAAGGATIDMEVPAGAVRIVELK
jgi:hypothetical protein